MNDNVAAVAVSSATVTSPIFVASAVITGENVFIVLMNFDALSATNKVPRTVEIAVMVPTTFSLLVTTYVISSFAFSVAFWINASISG